MSALEISTHAFRADRGDAGERLDRALCRHLSGQPWTRTQIQGWIAEGRARVDGSPAAKPAQRLALGQRVEIDLPPPAPRRPVEAEDLPLDIVFEDEHLLALHKPPGLVVHPAGARRKGTLFNALLHYAENWEKGDRPSLVSRLDEGTSGLLLVAKRGAVHARLAKLLRRERATKDYLALAYGAPPRESGKIDLPIAVDPADRRRRVVSREEGQPSLTLYESLAEGEGVTLYRCRLKTGRTHQIRIHLKALRTPIVGDPLYGEPRWKGLADPGAAEACRRFARQALHSWRLAFEHPATGAWMELEVAVPADLRELFSAVGIELPG